MHQQKKPFGCDQRNPLLQPTTLRCQYALVLHLLLCFLSQLIIDCCFVSGWLESVQRQKDRSRILSLRVNQRDVVGQARPGESRARSSTGGRSSCLAHQTRHHHDHRHLHTRFACSIIRVSSIYCVLIALLCVSVAGSATASLDEKGEPADARTCPTFPPSFTAHSVSHSLLFCSVAGWLGGIHGQETQLAVLLQQNHQRDCVGAPQST